MPNHSKPNWSADAAPTKPVVPIVKPITVNNAWLVVLCPYCGEKHQHGRGSGNRSADCADKRQYYVEDKEDGN